MPDPRVQIQKKFQDSHRFSNFGNALVRLDLNGFRLHKRTSIHFKSAVTAFCGANGVGKTTVLQLAACAYRYGKRGSQLRDFFAVGPLDRAPFDPNASLHISVTGERRTREYSLSRKRSRWSDYRVRDERLVLFLGSGHFVPRVESKDFIFRNAGRLTVGVSTPCAAGVRTAVAQIIGQHYDEIERAAISVKRRTDSLLQSSRNGLKYSEIHMGFGESRVHRLVERLEAQTDKSLILLEEPEISLHQAAQYRLGEYLVSLAIRKGHQILMSTHSEHLLRALPQASRILISRTVSGEIQVLPELTSAQAASLMGDGHDAALTVVVEDDVARAVLVEVLGALDRHFLATTRIVSAGFRTEDGHMFGGGEDAIRVAMHVIHSSGLRVAAVLDADMHPNPAAFVFCLPGSRAPEREIFESSAVRSYWSATYGLEVDSFVAGLAAVDHHNWFSRLSVRLNRSAELLVGESARVYAQALGTAGQPLLRAAARCHVPQVAFQVGVQSERRWTRRHLDSQSA